MHMENYVKPEVFELGNADELTLGAITGGWPDDNEGFIKAHPF